VAERQPSWDHAELGTAVGCHELLAWHLGLDARALETGAVTQILASGTHLIVEDGGI
jgi:hypothetical protein